MWDSPTPSLPHHIRHIWAPLYKTQTRMLQSSLHKASDARAGCKCSAFISGEVRRRDHTGLILLKICTSEAKLWPNQHPGICSSTISKWRRLLTILLLLRLLTKAQHAPVTIKYPTGVILLKRKAWVSTGPGAKFCWILACVEQICRSSTAWAS